MIQHNLLWNAVVVGGLPNVFKAKSFAVSDKALNNFFKFSWVILGSTQIFSAESEGFEPPDLLQSTVFKTAAIDHSANSPPQKYKSLLLLQIRENDFFDYLFRGLKAREIIL